MNRTTDSGDFGCHHDYFFGYVANLPHPWMAATGTEGRCELCRKGREADIHREPHQKCPCGQGHAKAEPK